MFIDIQLSSYLKTTNDDLEHTEKFMSRKVTFLSSCEIK